MAGASLVEYAMSDQQTSILPVKCAYCGQSGSIVWNVPSATKGKTLENLMKVSSGFHWEVVGADTLLIRCDQCDEIQP
jgi:hypothetical protein